MEPTLPTVRHTDRSLLRCALLSGVHGSIQPLRSLSSSIKGMKAHIKNPITIHFNALTGLRTESSAMNSWLPGITGRAKLV